MFWKWGKNGIMINCLMSSHIKQGCSIWPLLFLHCNMLGLLHAVLAGLPKVRIRQSQSLLNCTVQSMANRLKFSHVSSTCERRCTGFQLRVKLHSMSLMEHWYFVWPQNTSESSVLLYRASQVDKHCTLQHVDVLVACSFTVIHLWSILLMYWTIFLE